MLELGIWSFIQVRSENATFVSYSASQSSGRQNNIQILDFVRVQLFELLRGADEPVALIARNPIFGECSEFADVIGAAKRFCAERMRVGHGNFIDELAAIVEHYFHAAPEGFFGRVR